MSGLIELSDVGRTFATDTVETAALRGVDLTIQAGEFVAITGPSGCGKSTLLNVIGTLDRSTEGSYRFEGREVTAMSDRDCVHLRRDRMGFIFQSFNLIDDLTIAENIELGLVYRGVSGPTRRERVSAAMDRVGIAHRAGHHPSQLSGGQQQRAAIARAIVGSPAVILADEPTGNLDSENGSQVMEILQALNAAGATILMVTHSPAHADIAGRTVNMLDGRVALSTTRAR